MSLQQKVFNSISNKTNLKSTSKKVNLASAMDDLRSSVDSLEYAKDAWNAYNQLNLLGEQFLNLYDQIIPIGSEFQSLYNDTLSDYSSLSNELDSLEAQINRYQELADEIGFDPSAMLEFLDATELLNDLRVVDGEIFNYDNVQGDLEFKRISSLIDNLE
jgi:hypothetical protein